MRRIQVDKADSGGQDLPGFRYYPGYLGSAEQAALIQDIKQCVQLAPYFRPTMPRSGRPFSVLMTNCGHLGWVSDQDGGYRYQTVHPETGQPWPAIPDRILAIWREVSDYRHPPEVCLINHYTASAKMGSHVDADEEDSEAPIVSISLGDEGIFHVGGLSRRDPKRRFVLRSGDVVVLGGAARQAFHGIDRIKAGTSHLVPGGGRINLTLRRVRLA